MQVESASEAVDGSALSLERIDDIHGGDSLSPGMLGVGDGISDDTLQEAFNDMSRVIVDEGRDPLDPTSPGQSPECRFGDALDGGLGVPLLCGPLGSDLAFASDSFAAFSLSSHLSILRMIVFLPKSNLSLPRIPNRASRYSHWLKYDQSN